MVISNVAVVLVKESEMLHLPFTSCSRKISHDTINSSII